MVVASDDVIVLEMGKKPGEPSVITVNCPDRIALGCDICSTILEFGLQITRGDVATDGKWCYVLIWVVPRTPSTIIRWDRLKDRLLSLCPPSSLSFFFNLSNKPVESRVYLLMFFSTDGRGLLHDVTHVLCYLEFIIHRVKVSTTPDGKVVDLFFITDGMELLHKKERQDELRSQLASALGESCVHCELQLAAPELQNFQRGYSSLSLPVTEALFDPDISSSREFSHSRGLDIPSANKANINIDNSLSHSHTLLQISCTDQKGLLYDILRTLKDCNIEIAYGRFLSNMKGSREVDLFIHQGDGKKIVDPAKQDSLCSRLRMEVLHPLRVRIVNRGPDTELLVANPVELCGKGRPRVFYDVTFALKMLGICIFSAEIGRHLAMERQWEVYRFLLEESPAFPLSKGGAKDKILDMVRRTLMN